VGVLVLCADFGVPAGKVWARAVGVIVAAISAVVNFAFIPIYPVWAVIIIALDVLVIWALTVYGRDLARPTLIRYGLLVVAANRFGGEVGDPLRHLGLDALHGGHLLAEAR
jgi:hypothetical protein